MKPADRPAMNRRRVGQSASNPTTSAAPMRNGGTTKRIIGARRRRPVSTVPSPASGGRRRAVLRYDQEPPRSPTQTVMTRPTQAAPPPAQPSARLAGWLARWGNILPLLAAEFIVWIGFGALLPIMPLYFTEHGVDLRLLGIVIAAWPIARLVGEAIFGWVADRTGRRVLLMVVGLAVSAIALGMPLFLTSPLEFVVLRALAGLATAVYDPAARGYLT